MKRGLLLVAHGARDPAWSKPFEAVVARVQSAAGAAADAADVPITRVAYLEHMTPNIDAASGALVREGCTRIDVMPLFLGSGGHVQRDVPAAVDALRKRHPAVTFRMHAAAGESDAIIDAMAQLALNATRTP
jgi:sirohydrochlorin cobaltochelatase